MSGSRFFDQETFRNGATELRSVYMVRLFSLIFVVGIICAMAIFLTHGNLPAVLICVLLIVLMITPAVLIRMGRADAAKRLFAWQLYPVTILCAVLVGPLSQAHFVALLLPPVYGLLYPEVRTKKRLWALATLGFVICQILYEFTSPVFPDLDVPIARLLLPICTMLITLFLFYRLRRDNDHIQESLARKSSHFESVISGSLDCIISTDFQHRITNWNLQAEKVFGYREKEVLGQVWYNIVIPKDLRWIYVEGLKETARTGLNPLFNQRREILCIRRNGETFPADASVAPVRIGDRIVYHGFIRDITARKHIERKILKSNAELEQFAAVASHDMKEPLRTISGFSNLLRHQIPDTSESAEFLHFIEDAAKRMSKMLDDLITYARSGNASEDLFPVKMEQVCETVRRNLLHLVVSSNAKIDCHNLPILMGTETLYTQLLQNLVNNGLKYQLSGNQPQIDIRGKQTGSGAEIWVRDNGIGIANDKLATVFRPFHRLHSRATYEGSGIGLATCQKIMDNLGGSIEVQSRPGAGTTFILKFPQNLVVETASFSTENSVMA